MSSRLKNKVAIITGTAGGQGRAAAKLFAAEGAKVVGCDIKAEEAEETVEMVKAAGGEMISMHPCDLTDPGQIKALVDLAVDNHGGIDVLYNNAAMAYFGWVEDITYETWSATIQQELDVAFRICKEAWPHLVARGGGSIINVGSVSGKIVYEVLPGLAHSAAKGGVIAMTRQLAMEGGQHGIRANTISPGLVRTAQTEAFLEDPGWSEPMMRKLMIKRVGEPEDVAPCAVFLASDESSWVTGADFAIDGGTTAW
jgi:NAD(P)-dependent dehydrogenase (short-subunit alcohol dehydrogenase family)